MVRKFAHCAGQAAGVVVMDETERYDSAELGHYAGLLAVVSRHRALLCSLGRPYVLVEKMQQKGHNLMAVGLLELQER